MRTKEQAATDLVEYIIRNRSFIKTTTAMDKLIEEYRVLKREEEDTRELPEPGRNRWTK